MPSALMRAVLVVAGALAAAWGGWLLWPHLAAGWPVAWSVLGWLLGGPVSHDLLLAPVAGMVGLGIAVAAPRRLRGPVAAGLALSAMLVLLALPGLVRPSPGPPNPGLADRNYPLGLAIALAATWLAVTVTALLTRHRPGDGATQAPPAG